MNLTKTQQNLIDKLWDFYGVEESRRVKICSTLEEKLGYVFKNKYLILVALTHSSAAKGCTLQGAPFYERLEFLGDSVLELCVSDILIKSKGEFSEGDLSKIRSYLVREDYLLGISKKLKLKEYMLLGKSFGKDSKKVDSILADMVEAVLGAIYIDSSFKKVYEVVANIYGAYGRNFLSRCRSFLEKDYKTVLQEYIQEKYKETPVYSLGALKEVKEETSFEMMVSYCGKTYCGTSSSKRKASQLAAKKALKAEGKLK